MVLVDFSINGLFFHPELVHIINCSISEYKFLLVPIRVTNANSLRSEKEIVELDFPSSGNNFASIEL